jgi:hypothetical protein
MPCFSLTTEYCFGSQVKGAASISQFADQILQHPTFQVKLSNTKFFLHKFIPIILDKR